MAHVKLDILTKDFVVTVLQDSLVYTARNVIKHKTVRWTQYLMIIIEYSEGWKFLLFIYVACSFDFEDGIGGWERTGTAFIHQPTFGDNPAARNRESAQQQGDWWIGGAENRPSESRTSAPRRSRPTPRNSHFRLFPYRWQRYLVSHRWRMYQKWYSCGAYCRKQSEVI